MPMARDLVAQIGGIADDAGQRKKSCWPNSGRSISGVSA
jgi:hypothetical protein